MLTKVVLSKDQSHGEAWGRLVWRGRSKTADKKIGPSLKSGWTLYQAPDYHTFSPTESGLAKLFPEPIHTNTNDSEIDVEVASVESR